MAFERTWPKVPPVAFAINGGEFGLVTLPDTAGFRVKQVCAITSNTLPPLPVQVKIVLSPTTLIVGSVDNKIANWKPLNISAYTVAIGSALSAEWQDKNNITIQDIEKATYEADPVVARRVIPVDQYGQFYSPANTLPVNIIPNSGIPFTLGALTLPDLVNQFVSGLTYDQVISTTFGNQETLSFYEGGVLVNQLTLTQTAGGWTLDLGYSPTEGFLALENSSGLFVLENGSGFIELE